MREAMKIPRILHQIWLGEKPLPEEFERYRKVWKEKHPDWAFMFWTNPEPGEFVQNRALYEAAQSPTEKSDILRLEILHHFGGLYVDTDFECVKNVEPLLEDASCVLARMPEPDGNPPRMTSAFMACVPGDAFVKRCIDELPAHVAKNANLGAASKTGPYYIDRFVKEFPHIKVLDPPTVYPYGPRTPDLKQRWYEQGAAAFPETYAVHHFDKTRPGHWTQGAAKQAVVKDNRKAVVHLSHYADGENGLVRRYAESRNCRYVFCDLKQDMFKNAEHIKNAALCIIWSGLQWTTPLATSLLRKRNIPHCFYEQGLLPQKTTYMIDPQGMVGNSILGSDCSWVTDDDMQRLYEERAKLQKQYPLSDEGFVLVPMQIHNDSQVLHFCPYNDMTEFVAEVEAMYPNQRIIARAHPKGAKSRKFKRAENHSGGSFLEQAAKASVIVSLTSTCLYEAAILGKPVVALGDHPLRLRKREDVDRVLAGALALRVDRESGDIGAVLDRFGVRPL